MNKQLFFKLNLKNLMIFIFSAIEENKRGRQSILHRLYLSENKMYWIKPVT